MRVLVTGASGFIGGAAVQALKRKNWQVKPLIREGMKGDLRNYRSILKETKGMDLVINCAAVIPHHKLPDKDYWDINVNGVKNVVQACIKNKVGRLIQISSVAALDLDAKDIYAKSKHEGDMVVINAKDELESVIIRPTIAYGPGDTRPVILRLFRLIKKGIGITVDGGNNFLHTVYIDNLVSGIVLAATKKVTSGDDFILGDEKCYRMNQIISIIGKVQGKKYINIDIPKPLAILAGKIIGMEKTVRFNSEDRKYSIQKAKTLLGYRPNVDLLEGMKRTYEWYKNKAYI